MRLTPMNQKQALSKARKILGKRAVLTTARKGSTYPNGSPYPTHHIGINQGFVVDTKATGFTWQEALDNLKEKQHA